MHFLPNDQMKRITSPILETLAGIVGDRVSQSDEELMTHASVLTYHDQKRAEVIVYPNSTEEVSEIVQLCASESIPVIPYGAGSSLEGQITAIYGGLCMDLRLMNKIKEIYEEDQCAIVQAGVRRSRLDQALERTALFFPIGPGFDASIGGMVSTRASGINAVRYGTMRENLLSLEVVLPDGKIITTGTRARKSSTGYDLTHLFTGAEGTLGVITEAALKLHFRPGAVLNAVCSFARMEDAVGVVRNILSSDINAAQIELLDEVMMAAINSYSGLDYPPSPTLFLEFHGSALDIEEGKGRLDDIVSSYKCLFFECSSNPIQREKLWQARVNALPASLSLRKDAVVMTTDACVPVSRLLENIVAAKKDVAEAGLIAPLIGHVGDGNFHLGILVNPSNKEEMARAKGVAHKISLRAIESDGTCSGEHGIGTGKLGYMKKEHGHSLSVMRQIKRALDPQNIMNPGKLVVFEYERPNIQPGRCSE